MTGVVTYKNAAAPSVDVASAAGVGSAAAAALDEMTTAAIKIQIAIIPPITATTEATDNVLFNVLAELVPEVSFSETKRTWLCKLGYTFMSSRNVG